MKYVEIIVGWFAALVFAFVIINGYNKIANFKLKKNITKIIIMIVFALIATLLNLVISAQFRWLSELILIVILLEIVFKEKIVITILKTLLLYIFVILCDFLLSVIIMLWPNPFDLLNGLTITKSILTIVMSGIYYLLFMIKPLVKNINNFFNYIEEKIKYVYIIIGMITVLAFYVLAYFYVTHKTLTYYIVILVITAFLVMICVIVCIQYLKNKNSEKEQEALLKLMNEYETLLEIDKENRHEMLNNLVVLKSYKNKSSKEYEKILENMINQYQNNKTNYYSNIYKLPSGVKGIVYYKINNIINQNIKFNTLITKESYKRIEALNSEDYYKVCKILGILLDNAIEACQESEEKELLIDIYNEDDNTNIYIENSFKGKINIKELSKRGYSTKGRNRGLGLDIVSKLIKKSEYLKLEQYIYKERFVSILKITNNKNS